MPRRDPDMCTHNESPLEDSEIVEITSEFICIQEGGFLGYDPELDDDEDEDDPDPSIEIQELTDLEVFMQTLQKAHDAATAAEHKCQKGNKRPRTYLGNSNRTQRHHEINFTFLRSHNISIAHHLRSRSIFMVGQ